MSEMMVNGIKVPFIPVGGTNGLQQSILDEPQGQSFQNIFEQELREVKFSKHAQERLDQRSITLNGNDITQIEKAVDKAEAKGAQDSLVLLRDMAFIVNIKNRTVVTAIDQEAARNNVFTNIDSAVIAS
jgi:flagellar operon protein